MEGLENERLVTLGMPTLQPEAQGLEGKERHDRSCGERRGET
jgi:hypothetical protein